LYDYLTPKLDFKRKFNHRQSFLYKGRLTVRMIWKFRFENSDSNRIITMNRIPNRKFDSTSNRISKLRRSLQSTLLCEQKLLTSRQIFRYAVPARTVTKKALDTTFNHWLLSLFHVNAGTVHNILQIIHIIHQETINDYEVSQLQSNETWMLPNAAPVILRLNHDAYNKLEMHQLSADTD